STLREKRSEIAAGDLGRRPPEGFAVGRRRVAASAAKLSPKVRRDASRQDQSTQDWIEGMSLELRAGASGDVLGGGIGLLGGDPALLDVKAGDVAGRVDVVETTDTAVLVGGDETGCIVRNAGDRPCHESRQG